MRSEVLTLLRRSSSIGGEQHHRGHWERGITELQGVGEVGTGKVGGSGMGGAGGVGAGKVGVGRVGGVGVGRVRGEMARYITEACRSIMVER